jgi:peptide/nickel transport system permease protein
MIIVLMLVLVVAFVIINLPPGSWIENYAAQLESQGNLDNRAELDYLTERYGLDQPLLEQYVRWIVPVVTRGDFGQSFEWRQPVWLLIRDRLLITIVMSLASLALVYVIAIPIALYSATHQYSPGDYIFSFFGLIGLATPSFLLALVFMLISVLIFNITPGGLFSPQYLNEPWSLAKRIM